VAPGEPGRRPARCRHAAGVHLGAADFSAGPGIPYVYNLDFVDPPDMIPAQHYIASAADWRSRPPRATVPLAWTCPDGTQHCAVQPMLTIRHRIDGLDLNGSAPAARQVIGIDAEHLQSSAAPAVRTASARVSFNSGLTWQPASVTELTGGQFKAVFTAPAGAVVSLRVTAADPVGGSLAETILRAYRTGS
jgi:hypothetical protein